MDSKISDLLNKINRLTCSASFPRVSKLEFDLLMEHVRNLYDELDLLRNLRSENRVTAEVDEPLQSEDILPESIKLIGKINLPKEKMEDVIVVKKEEPVAIKTDDKVKAVSKSSINEVIQSTVSLNSKLKPKSSQEVQHKLSTKPLKELINLNKRFIFINKLFNGNTDAFTKAVHQIDSLNDFTSAESFIRSYHWDEPSETVNLFMEMVKQRFGVE